MKLNYDNYLKNPIIFLGHDLSRPVGKLIAITDDGYEIELIGKEGRIFEVKELEKGYNRDTGEVLHLSIPGVVYSTLNLFN